MLTLMLYNKYLKWRKYYLDLMISNSNDAFICEKRYFLHPPLTVFAKIAGFSCRPIVHQCSSSSTYCWNVTTPAVVCVVIGLKRNDTKIHSWYTRTTAGTRHRTRHRNNKHAVTELLQLCSAAAGIQNYSSLMGAARHGQGGGALASPGNA